MMWDLFKEMNSLKRDFDRFFGNYERGFAFPNIAFLPGRAAREYPLINLSEDDHNFYVEALSPGINIETLNVNVSNSTLTISGEKPPINGNVEPKAFHRSERSGGKFIKTIELPSDVDESRIKAEYKNGLLSISLPKREKAKPKTIKIEVA